MNELLSNLLQNLQQVALIVFAWRLPEIIRAFKAVKVLGTFFK